MAQLSLHDKAVGPCIVCGCDSERSNYWIAMTDEQWKIVKPLVVHLFPDPNHVQKSSLFIPPLDKPLCGPECSHKWHQGDYDGNGTDQADRRRTD